MWVGLRSPQQFIALCLAHVQSADGNGRSLHLGVKVYGPGKVRKVSRDSSFWTFRLCVGGKFSADCVSLVVCLHG